ncbi:PREDICTED: uncharacterized protein LOC106121597 [Papilio xuthus]|uniref:Uncharacterized protein LOC106121597 n=1 Tax=Papilio xuthus TaxID=66420 RepID=A0AAJ6ZHL7_PAPXU|nr:PREDICTED: uncharacterized protein LOC106121597 [Papilio xuthus]XP_013172763.1 PREDICTED: uncharacterized protein LOC106121597 [Papilio xuthus]XP_013172765.1 PREDICTED: uncharacterized protein LOC106121597 [Papilio xuthus]
MGLPHITKFCWCMSLELGSKVIGYVHLMFAVASVTLGAATSGSAWGQVTLEWETEGETVYAQLATASLAVACFGLVHVGLAITLIYAAHKRKTTVVRLWAWFMCALWIAGLIYVLVSSFATRSLGSGSDIFLAFLEGVVFFGTLAYCILCVHSYYLVLRSGADMQGPSKLDY